MDCRASLAMTEFCRLPRFARNDEEDFPRHDGMRIAEAWRVKDCGRYDGLVHVIARSASGATRQSILVQ